eukprot:5796191-Pleurochrysis_carterae.AAC.1
MLTPSLQRLASRSSHASKPPGAPADAAAVWRSDAPPCTRPRPHALAGGAELGQCWRRQEPCLPSLLDRVACTGEPGAAECSRARGVGAIWRESGGF